MTVTDFHSHILPDVDDGSRSIEESLAMLREEARQGITRVVATPHFYANHDSPEKFLRRRDEAFARLQEAMAAEPGLPTLEVGAEVYYFSGISDSDATLELTIGKNRHILIEMPMATWTEAMYRELEGMYIRRGITPIIAHLDRYIGPFRTCGIPRRLAQLPVLVQANAEFFARRSTASMALRMLRDDDIHLLGSDCHSMGTRSPNLGAALEVITKRLGTPALEQIREYESAIFV